jgi:hypothetical protein
LFGILDLGYWDLFEIWFLVLGFFMIFIEQVILKNQSITCLNDGSLLATIAAWKISQIRLNI